MSLVLALLVTVDIQPWIPSYPGGPSDFAPAGGPTRVAPGTLGCRPLPEDVCYTVAIASSLPRLTLGGIGFRVDSPGPTPDPNATPIALGPGATVSVLDPASSVAGVWNFSSSDWTSGSGWTVPDNTAVWMVLDTGLLSNVTLAGGVFDVGLSGPYSGGVGFPLG